MILRFRRDFRLPPESLNRDFRRLRVRCHEFGEDLRMECVIRNRVVSVRDWLDLGSPYPNRDFAGHSPDLRLNRRPGAARCQLRATADSRGADV